jgi:MFS family permease
VGWRIPFLISIALIGVGLFIRLRVMESPLFERVKETKAVAKAPFIELIRTYPKQIVLAIGTRFATDITFNVINVFMLAYGTQQLGLPRDLFLKAILIGCAVALITLPLFGKLSDVVGRRTVYMFGAVFVIIYGFVFFRLIETKEPNFIVLAYIGGIAFSQASTYAVQSTWFAEIFGTRVRYTGASLPYQIAGNHRLWSDAVDLGVALCELCQHAADSALRRRDRIAEPGVRVFSPRDFPRSSGRGVSRVTPLFATETRA